MFLTMLIMGEVLLRKSPQDSGQKITTMMLKSSFKRYVLIIFILLTHLV